jgi:hypothetical protein
MQRITTLYAAGCAGSPRAGGATRRAALSHYAAIRVGEEQGELARGMLAPAVPAGDGRVGILNRTQGIKTSFTIQADVFVERHNKP